MENYNNVGHLSFIDLSKVCKKITSILQVPIVIDYLAEELHATFKANRGS
jgi:hypothetical protein